MRNRVDFVRINGAALARLPELLARWLPDGRVCGREYVARNPTRNDQQAGSFRVNVDTGKWADFATGDKGGDLVSLYAYLNGQSQGDAARALAAMSNGAPHGHADARSGAEPRVILPVPESAPAPVLRHREHGVASQHWIYRDAQSRVLGYVARFDTPAGKQILPLTYCGEPDGRQHWRWRSWPAPRPLYRLDALASRAEAPVLLVEGEKTADAAAILFRDYVVTTSPAGSKAAGQADWSPLRGRDVVILPDADAPGERYAAEAAQLARAAGAQSVRVVALPSGLPEGWDLADPLPKDVAMDVLRESVDVKTSPLACSPDWPERQPLSAAVVEVPALPSELLPEPLRAWIDDATERLQAPSEMVAAPALVTAGAVIGRSVGIHPKRQDDWLVLANLWGMVVGRPGTMKSPALSEGTRFIRRLAAQASERYRQDAAAADIEREAIELQIARLKRDATKRAADIEKFKTDLAALNSAKGECALQERRYLTQDATAEKLGELLRGNPRGLLLLRDELAGWLRTLEKPGREGEREFFLEAWKATDAYTCDRIGRGTVHTPAPTLSVLGTIQPSKLQRCITDAATEGRGDDGLLQRFQLAVWPEITGEWRNVDRWPETAARERVAAAFTALDSLDANTLGASTDHSEIPALRFAPYAQALFDEWREQLEVRLRGADLDAFPAYESHVAKYRSLMPALALVFHLLGVVSNQTEPGPVTLAAARLAATWVDFLDAHARRIYAVELNPGRLAARALADRIEHGHIADGVSIRDLYRHQWPALTNADNVRAALADMEALGWLRIEALETKGRTSEVVRLHPELREEAHGTL
ncbi:MAG: DUF3987 domain-containing protein [Deltaproteobacteria bacterium]|nr:DUF3987 domain-containing protein [Deltaproteobacteria bacterium]